MTKHDWMTACVVALGVAAMTVALLTPPICWAQQQARVSVPSLPSTQLTIPSIRAQVAVSAVATPGREVKVSLALHSPSGGYLARVPVTVTVLRSNMEVMSRSMPVPEKVTQIETTVPVGFDGNGYTVVEMPLQWAEPTPPVLPDAKGKARIVLQPMVSYQMVLSSTLGGSAAPGNLQTIIGSKVIRTANAQPEPTLIARSNWQVANQLRGNIGMTDNPLFPAPGRSDYIASTFALFSLGRWTLATGPTADQVR